MKNFIKKLLYRLYILLERNYRNYRVSSFIDKKSLIVGKHTYGINNLLIDEYKGSEAKVIIGSYCSIGPKVRLITGGYHPVDWVSTYPFKAKWKLEGAFTDGMPYTNGDINIKNDVWIGTDVIIMSGITIGNGAVIAAGSLVSSNVPDYAVVGGVPAKVVKYRFSKDAIEKLLEIKWWDWSESKIKENVEFLNTVFQH